uniref:ATP synthase complex subunit 8 n=1 Tax=Babina subaspera TaxID=872127 RepID=U6C7S1_BABSU|nr:ATP synthase F0 subunit 8 [Babina subaspera]BAO04476.1 ATPase subunit 8 [Babina subaspera]
MPQLNPVPWLIYFLLTWLILLFLAPQKILSNTNPNEPGSKNLKTTNYMWTWPW